MVGLYDWSGNNPLPPEILLLPTFLPIHPEKLWCHYRLVYSPMSYLYGNRWVGSITETVLELRIVLLPLPHDQVDWNKAQNLCEKVVMQHIHYGDENPHYVCIGALNKLTVIYWLSNDGRQLWDAAFAIQLIVATELAGDGKMNFGKAHDFIKSSQV
ncbi:hypothetical protein EJ110_NYTH22932 [Nymphaea thermarum]|nr:hypothetical protein EJ110_NYTH22932 [Nymphaea thermarum]